MTRKIIKQNKRYIWISIFIGIVVIILFLLIMQGLNYKNLTTNLYQNKIGSSADNFTVYHSKALGISINVPNGYAIIEELGILNLNKLNTKEKIVISGIGTNSNDLDGYLIDITNSNHLEVTNKQSLAIDGQPAIKAIINDKSYYMIYKDNWITTLTTTSKALYSDLDQVASSLRYEP